MDTHKDVKKLLPLLKNKGAEFRKKFLTRHGCFRSHEKVKQVNTRLGNLIKKKLYLLLSPQYTKTSLFFSFLGLFFHSYINT
jgi:hypothetical protein